ncbi:MAG TPA: hypothetical protein VGF24_12785 [Vicinamibacterales bacterium]|jgi:hypothetical protein
MTLPDQHTDALHTEFSLPLLARPLGDLGDFALEPGCTRGVYVDDVDPGTLIVVHTRRSCYRFLVTHDHCATAIGGSVFPEPTEVRIVGSTVGGSIIKAGWIGVGLRLELSSGLTRITTSCVRFLSLEKAPSASPAS